MARPDSSQGQTAVNYDSDAAVPPAGSVFAVPDPATAGIEPVTLHAALSRVARMARLIDRRCFRHASRRWTIAACSR